MAIRNISQVSCSLNLGLIYSVDYSFSPQDGASITLFFVSQNGTYSRPRPMQKAQIRIGSASFSMYVVASDIQLSSGRRVMSVDFVDDTFQLNNYWVTLTGRGCGYNVFELGEPVDNRTPAQKAAAAIDSDAQEIAELTEFPDLEYSFNDFLTILRRKFSVQINANYDNARTSYFTGTFRSVLDEWCALFNLSWYVENSVIKIFDPTKLTITLPSQPTDAIEYSSSEDVRSTYGKTCYNWFQQEGGQFSLNQTSNDDGALLVRTDTLYPVGYEFGLPQTNVDLNQVAAAQYGREFWILYNYSKGSLSEVGWQVQPNVPDLTIYQSAQRLNAGVAAINAAQTEALFDMYYQYGQQVAGRWYLSAQRSELATDREYTWFDESEGQIFSFTNVEDKSISLEFLTPTTASTNYIPTTTINDSFPGVAYVGNRIAYRDGYERTPPTALTTAQENLLGQTYTQFIIEGSSEANYGGLDANSYIMYSLLSIPTELQQVFNTIPEIAATFTPRFDSIPIKGITTLDYSTLKTSQTEQDGIEIVNGSEGGSVISNTAVIKTLKEGAYTVYYDKYQRCASAHSTSPDYFGHRFEPYQVSSDNEIGITFTKPSANIYKLNRNFSVINALVNNPNLQQMAQPRSFPTRRVSFTVNYFYNVPTNFLTNGLVGLSVSIGDNGVTASYSYSNEVLEVPYPDNRFAQYEQSIRNSWIRQYRPNQVIS